MPSGRSTVPARSEPIPRREGRHRGEPVVVVVAAGCGVVAGTDVASERGAVPVETVRVGERVYARTGLTIVTAAGATAAARRSGGAPRVLVAHFNDSRTLAATPDVKLYVHDHRATLGTWGGAYVEMAALGPGMAVLCWPEVHRRGVAAPYLRYRPVPYHPPPRPPHDGPDLLTTERLVEAPLAEDDAEILVYHLATEAGTWFANGILCAG